MCTKEQDFAISSIEQIIYKSAVLQLSTGDQQDNKSALDTSNYLLSFFEYCKTLHDYFRSNSNRARTTSGPDVAAPTTASYFSILNSSPASLICKLLFEDGIKPQLIESLTQKLNLNLTAIILHNSCPRSKLAMNQAQSNAIKPLLASFKRQSLETGDLKQSQRYKIAPKRLLYYCYYY